MRKKERKQKIKETSGESSQPNADFMKTHKWLWVKHRHPEWNPAKWIQRPKPVVPWWFNVDPYPNHELRHSYQDQISIFDFNMRPGPSDFARPDCTEAASKCPKGTNPGRTVAYPVGFVTRVSCNSAGNLPSGVLMKQPISQGKII